VTTNPARWVPDPTGRHELRYWDGTAWTEHVSDRGVTGRDVLPGARPASEHREQAGTGVSIDPAPDRGRAQAPPRNMATTQRSVPSKPTPIITNAGWSTRTKLFVCFIAVDTAVAAMVIWFVQR
jgi:hypothetical protein